MSNAAMTAIGYQTTCPSWLLPDAVFCGTTQTTGSQTRKGTRHLVRKSALVHRSRLRQCVTEHWLCAKRKYGAWHFTAPDLEDSVSMIEVKPHTFQARIQGGRMGVLPPIFFANQKKLTVYHLSTARIFIDATSGCQMPGNRI
jgi:hypothetical protein